MVFGCGKREKEATNLYRKENKVVGCELGEAVRQGERERRQGQGERTKVWLFNIYRKRERD